MSNRLNHTYGLDPNYAAENKWYLYLPLKNVLGNASTDLDLAINQFYLPALEVGTVDTAFKGYSITLPEPRLINANAKTMKFRYIVNDDWYNYGTLYTWAAKLGILNNASDANTTIQAAANEDTSKFLTARLYLLTPFKKKIVEFVFEYAFLKNFGEILLTYENSNPVTHDITLSYNFFKINRPTPIQLEENPQDKMDHKNDEETSN
jgi:hypothetical protein